MTEKEMTKYLQEMKRKKLRFARRRRILCKMIESSEDTIFRLEQSDSRNSERQYKESERQYKEYKKISRILNQEREVINSEIKEAEEELIFIRKEEHQMKKVRQYIQLLPMAQADVLVALYVEGMSWENYARQNYISRATVGRIRKKAIHNLLCLYELALTEKRTAVDFGLR